LRGHKFTYLLTYLLTIRVLTLKDIRDHYDIPMRLGNSESTSFVSKWSFYFGLSVLGLLCNSELKWLDMSINLNKSCCLRIGPRSNIICAAVTSLTGHKLPWVSEMRYLGVYFVQSRLFKCSLDAAKRGFYRAANSIFGKVGRIEEVILQLILSKCMPILICMV